MIITKFLLQRRLILISLDWTRPKDPPLSLGHASILANLRRHQVDVVEKSWSVNCPTFASKNVSEFIKETIDNKSHSQIDVAIGAFIWNEKYIHEILGDLEKSNFRGRIILGGPQISYVKSGLEKFYPRGDVFIRGYAEDALVRLMKSNHGPFPAIRGVHFAQQPDLGLSARVDLDKLPSPFLTGLIRPQRFIRWESQRGCAFKCAFCQHRESGDKQQRGLFDTSRIFQEAEWITENKIIQDVAVLDPIFNSGPNYLSILDKLIEGKFSGKISFQSRIEMVTPEFLNKLCRLNETSRVVLEFGLQTIHANEQAVINRPNNMRKVARILEEVRRRGIHAEVSLIFGLPKQTLSSFKKSVEFCLNLQVPVIHAFPLMLLRGTPLFYEKQSLGLVESNEAAADEIDRVQSDIPHVVASPSFNYQDWKQMAQIAANLATKKSELSDFV